ncbi:MULTISPECIES: hypothetical protein [Promicromonospora]|uniref:Uncharacterized protein n=2 Tax=Promicromonospora TaxID=43676 RepID=A0ABW4V3X1_9MICO
MSVELKRPGGEVRKRQRTRHAKLRRDGARVDVIDNKAAVDDLVNHLVTRLAHGAAADTIQKGDPTP